MRGFRRPGLCTFHKGEPEGGEHLLSVASAWNFGRSIVNQASQRVGKSVVFPGYIFDPVWMLVRVALLFSPSCLRHSILLEWGAE